MDTKQTFFPFAPLKGRKLSVEFDEPLMSSDGGLLLLREEVRDSRLISRLAHALRDSRHASYIDHTLEEMLTQRVLQICCGYEDADDCDRLRDDPLFKLAAERTPEDPALASQPTMSRLENRVGMRQLVRMAYALVDEFIESFDQNPEAIVLDLDPSADHTHGLQQGTLFNAFEGEYCYMPFHLYDGVTGKLITTLLRPGRVPSAEEILLVLRRVVRRLRRAFPEVTLVFRGDSHHTKPAVMAWMEQQQVDFCTGVQPNPRLRELFASEMEEARRAHQRTGRLVRRHASRMHQVDTWSRPRRVICRILVDECGEDIRFIVTSFHQASAKYLYETVYSGRGKMELMILDHKVGLRSDRTSCHRFTANQFRLLLHSAAYVLMHRLRSLRLKGTSLEHARFETIRVRLLKIGTRIETKKTRIRFHMPAFFPEFRAFSIAAYARGG